MTTDINIADIVVHLHQEVSEGCKHKIDAGLRAHDGVVSVHFDVQDHPHALIVAYDTDATNSGELLGEIRKCDKGAVMASL